MGTVVDASGKAPMDLGNIVECSALAPYATYCVGYIQKIQNGTDVDVDTTGASNVPIAIGLCLPVSCNVSHAVELARESLAQWNLTHVLKVEAMCDYHRRPLPTGSIVVLCFVCLLISFVLLGTMLECCCQTKRTPDPLRIAETPASIQYPNTDDGEDQMLLLKPKRPTRQKVMAGVRYFLHQFSLVSNFNSFVKHNPGELNALNGLRVVAMLWIIFGHVAEFYSEFVGMSFLDLL